MTIRRVEARQGLEWLLQAARLMAAQPAPYLMMGLALTVLGAVPLLGALALVVLGPAFNGGLMVAAREQQAGRPPLFGHLLAAFQRPGKLPPMLALCLPGLAAGVVFVFLALIIAGGAILGGAQLTPGQPGAGLGGTMLVLLVLAALLGLFAYALVFFATARVMLDDQPPVAAMRESLAACLANPGALLLFLSGLLSLVMAVLLLFAGWLPVLAQMLIGAVISPWVAVATLMARQDVIAPLAPRDDDAPPPVIEA